MATVKNYRELLIWIKSKELTLEIYKQTISFPEAEKFGLTDQIRRSSVSVPSNIAEGFGRQSINDFRKFLRIARGSLYELQTQMILSYELRYMNISDYNYLYSKSFEIEKMINSFISKMKN